MKKYLISLIILVLIGIYSCQEQQVTSQYFDDSPEIDLVKTSIEAYLNQDWETYNSCYSDTAMIWKNTWGDSDLGMTIDENVESMKVTFSSFFSYSFEQTILFGMDDNEGVKYVYFWSKWTGKLTKDGDEIVIPIHLVYYIVDNKIVAEYGFWDNLPIYLAKQALETEEK